MSATDTVSPARSRPTTTATWCRCCSPLRRGLAAARRAHLHPAHPRNRRRHGRRHRGAARARCPMPRSSRPISTSRCSTSRRRAFASAKRHVSCRPTRSSCRSTTRASTWSFASSASMFYPDKVQGNAEARRVLRDGGRYLLVIWDRIERNPSERPRAAMRRDRFPDNPPLFMERDRSAITIPNGSSATSVPRGSTRSRSRPSSCAAAPSADDAARGALLRLANAHRDRGTTAPSALDDVFFDAVETASQVRRPRRFRRADVGAHRHRD